MAVACIALSPLVSSAMMGGGWYFLAGQCFLAVGALLYPFTPPMVLVLGRSSESTGDAVKALNFALMPYRYVALLPGRRVGAAYLNESSHNLRTPEYARWRDQVEDLEEIAVLIVMDTRELTEHVSYEVASILDRGHAGKTLWVACADGSMPVLEGFRERLGERRIRVVRIEALESWIREFKQVLRCRRQAGFQHPLPVPPSVGNAVGRVSPPSSFWSSVFTSVILPRWFSTQRLTGSLVAPGNFCLWKCSARGAKLQSFGFNSPHAA
jgi:hypothetical protein